MVLKTQELLSKSQELLSTPINKAKNALKLVHQIMGKKQTRLVEVDYQQIALIYDEKGCLQQILPTGSHHVDEAMQVVTLDMDKNMIDPELAMEIIKINPVLKSNIVFYELKENHYLLITDNNNTDEMIVYREARKYAFWKYQNPLQLKDIDCEQPDQFWSQASIYEKDCLKKKNIICEATIQPDETDILLHYYKNELLEVIHKPGTYIYCNHKGQHILFPIKSWQTCLKSQTTNPMLAEYTKAIQLKPNQILIARKGIYAESRIFDKPGDYYFWKLPGDDMTFDVIDGNNLIVSDDDREKLTPYFKEPCFKNLKSKIDTMPSQWEEYHWRYLIADNKIIKQFSPDDIIVWIWKNQAEKQGAYFRMIPHQQQKLKLANQTVYTKDKTSVKLSLVIPYTIQDTDVFIQKSPDIFYQLGYHGCITGPLEMEMHLTLQMVLREIIQNYSTEELIEKRNEIQTLIYNEIKPLEETYGLSIQTVYLRDIILTKELQEILNQIIVAEKKAQVKCIERKDEIAANRSLINTSKLLQEHPGAFALRKLQTVETICEKIQTLHLSIGDGEQI